MVDSRLPQLAGLAQCGDAETPWIQLFQRPGHRNGAKAVSVGLYHRQQPGTEGSLLHGTCIGCQIG
jgi:hypothetical protein